MGKYKAVFKGQTFEVSNTLNTCRLYHNNKLVRKLDGAMGMKDSQLDFEGKLDAVENEQVDLLKGKVFKYVFKIQDQRHVCCVYLDMTSPWLNLLKGKYDSMQFHVDNKYIGGDKFKVTELYTVQEAVERLRKLIPSIPEWLDLLKFLPRNSKKETHYNSAVASHLGAVLELVKEGSVSIKQDSKFSPIFLRKKREIND